MFDVDGVDLLARELLRERAAVLVAEACAWSVGLSDAPHRVRRHARVVASGVTLGARAAAGLPLSGEEDRRLELGEPRPGTFADALGALTERGTVYADLLDELVLAPYVLETCVLALERAAHESPDEIAEMLDELGEDGNDPVAVIRAGEWEAPLRIEGERLVLAALGELPLIEVEAEGLPLSLVKAAEAEARRAAPVGVAEPAPADEDLAGVLFLAEAAVAAAELTVPVPPAQAGPLLAALGQQGLEPQEVLEVLPYLPVQADTAERVAGTLSRGRWTYDA